MCFFLNALYARGRIATHFALNSAPFAAGFSATTGENYIQLIRKNHVAVIAIGVFVCQPQEFSFYAEFPPKKIHEKIVNSILFGNFAK